MLDRFLQYCWCGHLRAPDRGRVGWRGPKTDGPRFFWLDQLPDWTAGQRLGPKASPVSVCLCDTAAHWQTSHQTKATGS